jgi:hypothetical protein
MIQVALPLSRVMRRSDTLRLSAPLNGSRSLLRGSAGQYPNCSSVTELAHRSPVSLLTNSAFSIINPQPAAKQGTMRRVSRHSLTVRHLVGGAEQSVSTIDTDEVCLHVAPAH